MRTFTFADIAAYKAAKASGGAIYAALIGDANLKSGAVVSKITATGDVLIDAMNPFVTPNLATNDDILYYSSTEGYRSLRKGKTTWDANSLGQIYIDTSRLPSGFAVVAEYNDIFSFKAMTQETTGSGRSKMTSIRGNSVAWNQLITDPNFTDASKWSVRGFSISISNNMATLTVVSGVGSSSAIETVVRLIASHKYVFMCDFLASRSTDVRFLYNGFGNYHIENVPANSWKKVSTVLTPTTIPTYSVPLYLNVGSTLQENDTVKLRNYNIVDLTLLYGSAIDGMTDAQILAKFEAEFPNAYYDYNEGRLISNAASAMEVTGFNQWDEEWELGYIDENGDNHSSSGYIRSKGFIPVLSGDVYYFKMPTSQARVYAYNDSKSLVRIIGWVNSSNATFPVPTGASYIRFWCDSGYGTTYNNDICINLSDPSKNGTYEPYKKVIVPFDVTTIRVKSPNIWDEEWRNDGWWNDSGAWESNYHYISSKNMIPVVAWQTYYHTFPKNGYVRYYDANGSFLSSYTTSYANNSFTVPSGASYMHFSLYYSSTSPTYGNDICINKSDPGFNGKYFPHGSIVPFPDGLRSAGSVYDEIVGNKLIRRVGSVDLGSVNAGPQTGTNVFYLATNGIKRASNNNERKTGIICSNYAISSNYSISQENMSDKSVLRSDSADCVYLKDTSITASDISNGKIAKLSGVYLNYELATPEVFELDYPLTPIIYPAKGGTKRILPVNGSSPVTAPFSCMVQPI